MRTMLSAPFQEGVHYLAHTLARHTKFVGQLSKRDRVFGQAPALENAPLARVELAKHASVAAVIEFLAGCEHPLLVWGFTHEQILPFRGIAALAGSVIE